MFSLGIDFGTSGARAIAINPNGETAASARCRFAPGELASTSAWQSVLWQLLGDLDVGVRDRITRIAINGTSATVLLCDGAGQPLVPPLLYNDACARSQLDLVQAVSPAGSPALSATSSLVKALWWYYTLSESVRSQAALLCHQADWLASLLHGQQPVSDYHNALKLGYDVRSLSYPAWLQSLPVFHWFPAVTVPGAAIAPVSSAVAQRFGLPVHCQICAGTTDSIAAFLASGASQVGEAVTSLGSTLVLKLLSPVPVDNRAFGIYSHRLGNRWLVGGASNTGGAVLKKYFSASELEMLSAQISLAQPCELNYYPLNSPGERFPVNDPDYAPRLTPRPAKRVDFLYGLLDAISRIEAEGYQKLAELGTPAVTRIYTAGGGAQNQTWRQLRSRHLNLSVCSAVHTEAAYGSAKLAQAGLGN